MSYDSDLAPSPAKSPTHPLSPIPSSSHGHPHTCTLSRCVLLQLPPSHTRGAMTGLMHREGLTAKSIPEPLILFPFYWDITDRQECTSWRCSAQWHDIHVLQKICNTSQEATWELSLSNYFQQVTSRLSKFTLASSSCAHI